MEKGALGRDSLPEAVNILIKTLPSEARLGYIDCSSFPELRIRMDIPQRNHSSFVEIVYNSQKEEINISFHLIGQNTTRERRLARTSANLIVLALDLGFSPTSHQITAPLGTAVKWTFKASDAKTFSIMGEHLKTYLRAMINGDFLPMAFFTSPIGTTLLDNDPALKADILQELSVSRIFQIGETFIGSSNEFNDYGHIKITINGEKKIAAIYEIARSDPTFYREIADLTLPKIVAISSSRSKDPSRLDTLYSHIRKKGLAKQFTELLTSHGRLDLNFPK